MKKKVLSALLVAAMATTMLAGCGSNASTDAPAGNTEAGSAKTEKSENVITIWAAEAAVDFTKEKAEEFLAANPDLAGDYTVTVEPVGEGDAASNMITDVTGGADIFTFAQDQLARLVSAGALMPLADQYASAIASENLEGAANAVVMNDMTYAFPVTADNGYFLYYDKSVISEEQVQTLEGIVEACEAAGKNFYFEINSGWYQTAFFFGTGCTLEYEVDDQGNFVKSTIDYASDNGVKAIKAMINLTKSQSFKNGSSASKAVDYAAIVDGTWDRSSVEEAFGENMAVAKLPTFTVDGETFQLGGFSGYKMMGIKPQTDAAKQALCLGLAQYLTSEDVQVARYEELKWGPSNKAAAANDAVAADPTLAALAAQQAFDVPQGNYPNEYWSDATALGNDITGTYEEVLDADGNGTGEYELTSPATLTIDSTDDEIMAVLTDFQALEESYVK